jgi:hypothetical protein
MNMAVLLDKLTEIELSIGVATDNALRSMVIEAQDCILDLQKARVEQLHKQSTRHFLEETSASRVAA